MKTGKMIWIGFLTAAIAFTACNNDNDDVNPRPSVSAQDRDFMAKAAYGNRAEIEMGQLADSLAMNDSVSVFGQMMVHDHQMALDELNTIAADWNIDLPETPDSVHQILTQALTGLSGYTFDTAYIHSQILDHQLTIALFESEAADSTAAQRLKDYVNKYLPVIRMHLEKADSISVHL